MNQSNPKTPGKNVHPAPFPEIKPLDIEHQERSGFAFNRSVKENSAKKRCRVNFFLVPHIPLDDDKLRRVLSHAERDFFLVLCHLSNRYADKSGWFWHTDKLFMTRGEKERGFAAYGFSQSTCKRVRKKLLQLELIETKKDAAKYGRWPGTAYRISPRLYKSTGGHSEPRSESTMNPHHRPP